MKQNYKLSSLASLIFCGSILLFSQLTRAQDYRTYDGTGNNLNNLEWGAKGDLQGRRTTASFEDGIAVPAGQDRANPREVSNMIFEQTQNYDDPMGLSDFNFVWGQFIDHDITLVIDEEDEFFNISIPKYDAYMDPQGSGTQQIPLRRSLVAHNSGEEVGLPRQYVNEITAYIDGSGVYGSTEITANWLRTFSDGKLKVSSGNFLPFNTFNGEFNSPEDPNSPEMAMPFAHIKKYFVAGDIRANENVLLSAMHTAWVREHNRLCDELVQENPYWTDEQLYQHARKMVGGMIQSIVYNEWLPTLGVHLPEYTGYKPDVKPEIFNEFSVAAYRYGHTTINSFIYRMQDDGEPMPQGSMFLRDGFFNPYEILNSGGIYPFFKGMCGQVEQNFDCKMIIDLRNFLFGQPGNGGMDLAAINIQRGRERGLADYNTIRIEYGLTPINSFNEITSDPQLRQQLYNVYKDVNSIDPWVGMLAEDHMREDALFGELVMKIMEEQFTVLRDGDRYFFEIDAGLTAAEKTLIRETKLSDIIRRNTALTEVPDDIFVADTDLVSAIEVEKEIPFEFAVSPNPTRGRFQTIIEVEKSADGIIEIVNALGQIVAQRDIVLLDGRNVFNFNIAHLNSGIYTVNLKFESKLESVRLFKK